MFDPSYTRYHEIPHETTDTGEHSWHVGDQERRFTPRYSIRTLQNRIQRSTLPANKRPRSPQRARRQRAMDVRAHLPYAVARVLNLLLAREEHENVPGRLALMDLDHLAAPQQHA